MNIEHEASKNVVTSYRLSEDTKGKLQQQLKDLGLTQEQYFNKVVSLMEVENVKQNSFLSKDTTIIQSNLDAILNSFINISDNSNNLINNKDLEIEEQKEKYKNMLLNKENSITEANLLSSCSNCILYSTLNQYYDTDNLHSNYLSKTENTQNYLKRRIK